MNKKIIAGLPITRLSVSRNGVPLEIAIHPLKSKKIVISIPGIFGNIDGYNDKYRKLADFIRSSGIGAVLRTDNLSQEDFGDEEYEDALTNNVRFAIEYALEHSYKIAKTKSPDILLMGFSAGASAVAAVASEFKNVKSILLVAPSGDAGKTALESGLSKFKGKVFITVGYNDEVVGRRAGQIFYDLANKAAYKELIIVDDCDHQFRGRKNGLIMSKTPLWAFADDKTYPSPDNGIVLY
ncbi:MAG: hypothetical protein PHV30_12000 [Candidatus Margulisbacteria bacterium]|nr:hypothetical protein [Candidatus Margulisiibacteriota bacterium]